MEREVGLDGVLRRGGDKRIQRRLDRGAARRIEARGGQCCRLGFDAEPEVDHVEDILMGSDRRGAHGERRRLGHRQHE